MSVRQQIIDYSKGDHLGLFWRLFAWRSRTASRRHGGYIGKDAAFAGRPMLPHGLHGIYISRYARIGADCCIYQNVTIGEVDRAAPQIRDHCLIGAGAVLVGGITVGDYAKIGAGAVVCFDVPAHATVVAQQPRVIVREEEP